MTSSLELAIKALSDPATLTADAFRSLLVVARRMGAADLSGWLSAELHGYAPYADVPEYRSATSLPIELHFDGPMQSRTKMRVSPGDLPAELGAGLSTHSLRMPIAELEALASGDEDPRMPLPPAWVELYRHFIGQGQVPYPSMMILNKAALMVPSTYLRGIIDRIKTAALDLALSLEDVSPEVGSPGGPKVADVPQLAQTVTIHLTQIHGDGANVAVGEGAQAFNVGVGDLTAVLEAAKSFLAASAVDEFQRALADDGDEPGDNTRTFLQKVKSGSATLAVGVASSGAYDGLAALLHQAFPGFMG